MAEVASAYVTLLPSAKGFGAGIQRELGGDLDKAGKTGGTRMSGGLKSGLLGGIKGLGGPLAAAVAALGVGKLISDSINTEADFSKTIRQIGVAADVSGGQLESMRQLAKQMGADTTFSAQDAAAAMLELAKGGISPAVIQGGALKSVMSLAAAGELDLADAAGVTSAAMHTFNIEAKDTGKIADALAGGANASSADVSDLAAALTQAGTGAKAAGLNLNETVGALAAMADKGIQGSDAGTSLKTMLSRLAPQTAEAATQMKKLGLDFTDAKGNFVALDDVADQLHKKLAGLSESQRTTALNTIFGSDAIRAASTLYELGGQGIDKYVAATEKVGNAQKMADAAMGGTSGAIEKLKGSFDTAKLAVGEFLAPATVAGADLLGKALDGITKKVGAVTKATAGGGKSGGLKSFMAGAQGAGQAKAARNNSSSSDTGVNEGAAAMDSAMKKGAQFRAFFVQLSQTVQPLIAGMKSYYSDLFSSFSALAGPVVSFAQKLLPPLQQVASNLVNTLGPGMAQIGSIIKTQFVPAFSAILPVVAPIAAFLIGVFGGALVGALNGALNVVKGVLTLISGVLNVFAGLFTGDWSRVWTGLKQIVSGAFTAILGAVQLFLNVGVLKLFRTGFAALGALGRGGMKLLTSVFKGGFSAIGRLPSVLWSLIRSLFTRGISATGSAIKAGASAWVRLFAAGVRQLAKEATSGVGKVVSVVRGLPGKITSGLGNLGSLLAGAGRAVIQGFIDGIKGMFGSVQGTLGDLTSKLTSWKGPPKKDKTLLTPAGRTIIDGLIDGFTQSEAKVKAKLASLTTLIRRAFDGGKESRLVSDIKRQGAQLTKLAVDRGKLADKLKAANDKLKQAVDTRNQYRDQLASGIVSAASITRMAGADAGSIIKQLTADVASAKTFSTQLAQLKKLGLNKTTLQQIGESDVATGSALATALLQGGKGAIGQVNTLTKQLGTAAKGAGTTVASSMYDAGVQSAQGLVKGLESQSAALAAAAKKLANRLVAEVKKALKIKSPSQVFAAQVGAPSAMGVIAGLDSQQRKLDKRVQRMVTVPRAPKFGAPAYAGTPYQGAVRPVPGTHIENVYAFTPASLRRELDELERRRAALAYAGLGY